MNHPKTQHESYGAITLDRQHGNPRTMFGSHRKHQVTIRLEITSASQGGITSREQTNPEDIILIAELTEEQLVHAVTSMNQRTATPITIKFVQGDTKPRENPPEIHRENEFMQDVIEDVRESILRTNNLIDEIIEKSRGAVRQNAQNLRRELNRNLPEIEDRFQQHIQETAKQGREEE